MNRWLAKAPSITRFKEGRSFLALDVRLRRFDCAAENLFGPAVFNERKSEMTLEVAQPPDIVAGR